MATAEEFNLRTPEGRQKYIESQFSKSGNRESKINRIDELNRKHDKKKEEIYKAAKELKDVLGRSPSLGETSNEQKKIEQDIKIKEAELRQLNREDLELRKKEIYQEGDSYTEDYAPTGQFEYRITPETKGESDKKGDTSEKEKPKPEPGKESPAPGPENAPNYIGLPAEKLKRGLNVISIDEIVKGAAWRQAEEKVRQLLHGPEEEMTSGTRKRSVFNNVFAVFRHPVKFLQKSWVRMAEAGYKEKYYRDALDQITKNQNLMVELEKSYRIGKPLSTKDSNLKRSEHYEILAKVLEEYSNKAIEMEERGNKVTNPRVDERFQRLIYAYQSNSIRGKEWSREKFERVQRRYINSLKKEGLIADADFLGAGAAGPGGKRAASEVSEGRMYATNLFDIAQDYKNHVGNSIELIAGEKRLTPEQKEKLRDHVNSTLELDISLGAKLCDVMNKRPAGTFKNLERAMGWLQRSNMPILRRIAANPGAYAIAGAVLGNLGARSAIKLGIMGAATTAGILTGAWLPVVAGGLATGAFGAIRRNRELKADRAMHQRQKTLGKEYQDFRRSNLDRFQYDVKSTAILDKELDGIITASGGSYNGLNNDQKLALASIFSRFKVELAHVRAFRANKRDNQTVDLITAASDEEGKKYQTHYLSKTDLKVKLYNFLEKNNLIDAATKEPSNNNFNILASGEMSRLDRNINDVDKAFDSHRRKSAAAMGVMAGLAGAAGVSAGQKVTEWFMHGFSPIDRITAIDSFGKTGPELLSFELAARDKSIPIELLNEANQQLKLWGDKGLLASGWSLFRNGNKVDIVGGKMDLSSLSSGDKFSLIKELAAGRSASFQPTNSWSEFVKGLDLNNSQRVSYQGFEYQGTPPDKGVRAMAETLQNLAHNKRLHANYTELMMRFRDGGDGSVIVDASKMFGKELKAELASKGVKMEDVLAKGGKFYLALAQDNNSAATGSQFNPILLEMDKSGMIKVPKEMTKYFFQFKDGKLVQGPGFGLKQLVMDTGMRRSRDNAMIVEGIASRLGEEPTLEVPIPGTQRVEIPLTMFGEEVEDLGTPWAFAGVGGASRWQLEDERKKEEQSRKTGEESKQQVNVAVEQGVQEPITTSVEPERAGEDRERQRVRVGAVESSPGAAESEAFDISRSDGEKVWRRNKESFNKLGDIIEPDNLEPEEARRLISTLTKIARGDREGLAPDARARVDKFRDNFRRASRAVLTLPEFIYCLKKRLINHLEEIIKDREKPLTTLKVTPKQEIRI